MNILVITDVLWRNDNGVGNSYSNIFEGMPDVKIANICTQSGVSENNVSTACFQISEGRLIRNLKDKTYPTGTVEVKTETQATPTGDDAITKLMKRWRLRVFFWARELVWKIGKWNSPELRQFIDNFKPDLIFAQVQDKMYQNRIVKFVQEYTKKPLMIYVWDDVYSMKQFSISPLYWADRLMQRSSIRKLAKKSSKIYAISKEQVEEYKKLLKRPTGLLYKGRDFSNEPESKETNKPIEILYTGNLYSGRYKTIAKFCEYLEDINRDGKKAVLKVYSASPLSDKEIDAINIPDTSYFMGKTSESEVQKLQGDADILLHIEPFTLKGSLLCRLSFSTKLVDYFNKKKCIFAVGHSRCSSMKYLKRNDASIVCESYGEMAEALKKVLESPDMVEEYAKKAWDCGSRNHRIEDIQKGLIKDFEEAINPEEK